MVKRGQFFLIATLIIVAVIISIGTIYNYSNVKNENTATKDLAKEINYEGSKVIDNGVYTNTNQQVITQRIRELIKNYSIENPYNNLLIVVGNNTYLNVINVTSCVLGNVDVGGAGTSPNCEVPLISESPPIIPESNVVNVTFGVHIYTFNLTSGENFYLVIASSNEGETNIATQ